MGVWYFFDNNPRMRYGLVRSGKLSQTVTWKA